jgi:diguanylate cyclase (GGDEF)-like protein/PAS domain S-box-containing protein
MLKRFEGPGNGAVDQASRIAAAMLGLVKDAAITCDAAGRIVYLNPVAETLTGWISAEARGSHSSQAIRLINAVTAEPLPNPVSQALQQGRTVSFRSEAALIRRNGNHVPIEGHAAPISDDGSTTGVIVILRDASQTREIVTRSLHQAQHDSLTGLINRHEFEQRAERARMSARSQGLQHGLCHIDLDQFKIVNDTCGHQAGDELLRQLAEVLQARIRHRECDTLARLGGDEFGLLLEACPLEHARKLAHEILAAINDFRFEWQGGSLRIGASIGVTAITAGCRDLSRALSAADSACYAAKEKGRNRVHVYRTDDLELAARRGEMRWVNVVGDALSHDRFTLFFQPFIPLKTQERPGENWEILVRMIGSGNQLIPPGRFLTAAERYNLMPLLDRWVIRNAFAAYPKLHAHDGARGLWAINISPATLNSEGIIEFVRQQSAQHRVPPGAICFEISESAAAANVASSIDFIWGLKTDGFRFALDDFGIGMSSFSWVKTLPIDFLKIDGQFVKHMLSDKVSLSVIDAICRIASVMGLETIAECVENRETLERLEHLGVNYAQGYVAGHPSALEIRLKEAAARPKEVNKATAV